MQKKFRWLAFYSDLRSVTIPYMIMCQRSGPAVFNNDFRSSQMTTDNLDFFYRSLKAFYNICCETQQEIYINSNELLVLDNSQLLIGAPAQSGREMRLRIFA
ncbi:hypothetical protein GCK32_015751 [Trichostrongylus colubriformis]|uniref:Uncharacterized protein n=1 Tax=Trichostrongylus colubriformis TaxID=6319 RepID=A0AAN8J137_TRICO